MANVRDLNLRIAREYGIPDDLLWIIDVIGYGEGGWDSDAVGDNGHSVGSFQLHDQGVGAGMGDDRYDGEKAARKIMPSFAGSIKSGVEQRLQGFDLLQHVWFEVERPQDTPQARQHMQSAFEEVSKMVQEAGGDNFLGGGVGILPGRGSLAPAVSDDDLNTKMAIDAVRKRNPKLTDDEVDELLGLTPGTTTRLRGSSSQASLGIDQARLDNLYKNKLIDKDTYDQATMNLALYGDPLGPKEAETRLTPYQAGQLAQAAAELAQRQAEFGNLSAAERAALAQREQELAFNERNARAQAKMDEIDAKLKAGQLTLDQATNEFNRYMQTSKLAGDLFKELAPRSLPKGMQYIPGWEPGGAVSTLSRMSGASFTPLGREATTPINPWQMAQDVLNQTQPSADAAQQGLVTPEQVSEAYRRAQEILGLPV